MFSEVQKRFTWCLSSSLSALVTPDLSCRDNFWYWETVVLVQTLGLVAAQVFASSLDGFFQLTIMLVILVAGGLALARCHPFDQEDPQSVQVSIVKLGLAARHICSCYKEQFWSVCS